MTVVVEVVGVDRPAYRCCHCARPIFSDHGLGRYNLDAHEDACLDQQARSRARAARRASTDWRRSMRRSMRKKGGSMGSVIIPGVGQLGFPFEDVPEEVTE